MISWLRLCRALGHAKAEVESHDVMLFMLFVMVFHVRHDVTLGCVIHASWVFILVTSHRTQPTTGKLAGLREYKW